MGKLNINYYYCESCKHDFTSAIIFWNCPKCSVKLNNN